jgi:hypothetical protein
MAHALTRWAKKSISDEAKSSPFRKISYTFFEAFLVDFRYGESTARIGIFRCPVDSTNPGEPLTRIVRR